MTAPYDYYSGAQDDADVSKGNQWKQTYTWDGSGTPYAFDVTASGTASGSCSIDAGGFNNHAYVASHVSFNLNENAAGIGAYGDTSAGNGTSTGSYGPSPGGTKFILSASVDGNHHSTSYLLISVSAAGRGRTYFGGSSGNCTTSGTLSQPIAHGL